MAIRLYGAQEGKLDTYNLGEPPFGVALPFECITAPIRAEVKITADGIFIAFPTDTSGRPIRATSNEPSSGPRYYMPMYGGLNKSQRRRVYELFSRFPWPVTRRLKTKQIIPAVPKQPQPAVPAPDWEKVRQEERHRRQLKQRPRQVRGQPLTVSPGQRSLLTNI